MSIDANVAYVELKEDGSGTLHLCDRVPEGSRGQSRLHFSVAPYEVTALNGLPIWGGDSEIRLGGSRIATREGYTRISFIEREPFLAAVAAYHQHLRAGLLARPEGTQEKATPCADDDESCEQCNPISAECGAKFCTYEQMAYHNRTKHGRAARPEGNEP